MSSDHQTRNGILRQYYREGKKRKEAMDAAGISNTNTMSSVSSGLGLHWSWPLENRLNGKKPHDAPPSPKGRPRTKPAKPKSDRRHAVNQSRIESERLRAEGAEPEVSDGPQYIPVRASFGKPTHLSAREKRERNLLHLDADLTTGGGAFADIPSEIAKTFADFYEHPEKYAKPSAE